MRQNLRVFGDVCYIFKETKLFSVVCCVPLVLRNVGHLIMQGSPECSFESQSAMLIFGKDALRILVLGEEKKSHLMSQQEDYCGSLVQGASRSGKAPTGCLGTSQ